MKKLKMVLPYDPAIPFLGIYPDKTIKFRKIHALPPIFMAALFMIMKTWKHPKCSLTDEWIKMCVIHTHTQWNITQPQKKN